MSNDPFDRIEAIYEAVVNLPPGQQAAYLDRHCDDPKLRRQIESMLSIEEETQPLFGTPAMAERVERAMAGTGETKETPVDRRGEQIGRYRIVRRLGVGGMGIVYEAEQDNPRRSVALKVMRSDSFSRQMAQRFEIEAHVLGQLHHPGIAQIYESGLAQGEDGKPQPYFAMELISGTTLREYVRGQHCSTRQRLELMIRIAEAVHHAHQKGVIHRDLKPDNILVDESGQPKVLDFGVARAIDADVQVTTLRTDVGQIIGTLAYMSPEQLSGRPEELDTRSDVYALGVILYELLAGELPYDVRQRSVPDAMRMIQDDEPRRLSTFNAQLRGDLDTIVSKAMEKDKVRRYESAAQFASDIQRFLKDEPIVARPATTLYQLRKFAKRNKVLVGGVAAVFVVLVLGIIGTTSAAIEAASQRAEAESARDVARRDADRLRAVNEFVVGMLAEANPSVNPLNREMTVADMLDIAATRIQTSFLDAPEIRAEILATVGGAFGELGRYETAREQLTEALDIQIDAYGPRHEVVAATRYVLGNLLMHMGEFDASLDMLNESLNVRREVFGERHHTIAQSLSALGRLHFTKGEYDAADARLNEAIALGEEVMPDDHVALATIHGSLGMLAWQVGTMQQALRHFETAVELYRDADDEHHPMYVQALVSVGVVRRFLGQYDQAEAIYHEALEKVERTFGDEHPLIATITNNIGWLHESQGNTEAAIPYVRSAMEMRKRIYGEEHPDVSDLMHNLAALLARVGQLEEAVSMMRRALDIRRQNLGPMHANIEPALRTLADILEKTGELEEAEQLMREAVTVAQHAFGEIHHRTGLALQDLGEFFGRVGKMDEAQATLEEALEVHAGAVGSSHDSYLRATVSLARVLHRGEQYEEAERVLLQTAELLGDHSDEEIWVEIQSELVRFYTDLGRADQAERWQAKSAPGSD